MFIISHNVVLIIKNELPTKESGSRLLPGRIYYLKTRNMLLLHDFCSFNTQRLDFDKSVTSVTLVIGL